MINISLCEKPKTSNHSFSWFEKQNVDISPSFYHHEIKIYMKVEMEMLLWKFIDGDCTPQEEKEVKQLLIMNKDWQKEYEELMQMHSSLQVLLPRNKEKIED